MGISFNLEDKKIVIVAALTQLIQQLIVI